VQLPEHWAERADDPTPPEPAMAEELEAISGG
jgi:hypothetical protein